MLSATEILSALTIKRLAVEHDRFLKKNNKFQQNCKLQAFILKLVESYDLNLELQFIETFAESNYETESWKSFLQIELLNCTLLKPLGATEN